MTIDDSTLSANIADVDGGGIFMDGGVLTVQNGSLLGGDTEAEGNEATDDGGAIFAKGTSVTIDGSTVSANTAADNGGGIIMDGGVLTVQNGSLLGGDTEAEGNKATDTGGAIFAESGASVTIDDSTVSANTAAGRGGGIFMFGGDLTVRNGSLLGGDTEAEGNKATDDGGAIFASNGASVTIDDSTVSANTAAVDGGGILMQGAVLTVRNGSLLGGDTEAEGNKATNDGGAIFAQGTSVTIDGSTVSRNSAEDKGGAVFLASSTVGSSLFVNSTFSSNSAGDRAGGLNIESPTVIRNSTITGNRADSDGDGTGARGGIFTIADRLTMHNTIVAGNFKGTGTTPSDLDSGTSLVAGSSHNLIGSADGGTGGLVDGTDGNIVGVNGAGTRDINTILDTTLADNGGPTLTHALVFGSPTVDGGDNAQALDPSGSTLLTDQRQAGFDRFFDGIGNGTDTVDIGAFEADRDLVAPNVEAIVINGGDSQRSMVREITVNFSEIVNVDSSTLMVENLDTTVCYVPEVTRQAVDGKTIATLTFSGTDIVGGSLPDGNYRLTMLDTITDGGGTQLDGDADGAPGGNATDEFFRLYGDATGDGSVDIFDLLQFRTTYNTQNGDSNFNEAFDFGGDGNINVFDLLQFRTRYRTSV